MGHFSCFYGHVQSHKHKVNKSTQPSFEAMIKMLQIGSQYNASASTANPFTLDEFHLVKNRAKKVDSGTDNLTLAARIWKSGELKCDSDTEINEDYVHFELGSFRKSLSVGCELDQKERSCSNDDDCNVHEYSCEGSIGCDGTAEESPTNDAKSHPTSFPDQEDPRSSPPLSSDLVNHDSVFAVDDHDPHYFNKVDHKESHLSLYTEPPEGSSRNTPTQSGITKSYSMPNFGSTTPTSPGLSACDELSPCDGSFKDLNLPKKEYVSAHDASAEKIDVLSKEVSMYHAEKSDGENAGLDNYGSYNYGCSSKDWIVPTPEEIGMMRHDQGNSSYETQTVFTDKDFKIRLIEDWVMDLQHCSPVEETNEVTPSVNDVKKGSAFLDVADKVEMKVNPGMEAAKRYISSLTANANTAQLANYGLVVIPLLSAFVSLKALNLSGNSIVRITAGALPRGLHLLNLSKNKISTIEGLRELTRLRVLDLSYNKISRIGHGLASCSSLKELYLAGNKISEVEGLHRLLKLTVLDLRFNKIATSKCLGQLAANYNSLQAISLEGNPAQKNVGDEQLKKYLQGLLPHMAYYNRQHIKTSTLKDSSDRSVRLGISDRGLRSSDHKPSSRRGSGAGKRSSHSSVHGHKILAPDSLKQQSKGKNVLVPPSGSKTSHRQHHFDISNKIQSFRSGFSLHKSRSESTLAVL